MLILDNFLAFPEKRRDEALQADFRPFNDHGAIFPGIHRTFHDEDLTKLSRSIDLITDFQEADSLNFFRLTLEKDVLPTYIHTDVSMAKLTGILYLNPDDRPSGTSFWRHKELGLTQLPDNYDPTLYQKLEKEGLDETKWEFTYRVQMKFNRLVLFDSSLFHSPWPRAGWGDSPRDGRLLQVYFIRGLSFRKSLPLPDETL